MSVQLLDKTRKINKLLHNNNSSKVVFNDICAVMLDNGISVPVLNYTYGLGGRDTTIAHLTKVYEDLAECTKAGKRVKPLIQHINLRGKELSFFDAK